MQDAKDFDMKRNLIVNYLPGTLSQEDVKQMFARIGPVSNCKLVRNIATGQSLGYAFIEYPDEHYAATAISQIDSIQMQGKTIKVSYARRSSPEIKNANVYVAGLPSWVGEDKLESLFSPFGTVLSHKVLKNQDGSSRGAGFVRFSLNTEATEAIKGMAGKTLPDSEGPLTVKLAIPPASKQDSIQALNSITSNNLAGVGVATRTSNVRFNPMAPGIPGQMSHTASHPVAAVAAALSGMPTHATGINTPQGSVISLYVYGLQASHTDLTLYELFAPFGAILNVKCINDLSKEEKPCKGFGFVNFSKYEDAYKAVTSMNGVPFEEKVLQVSFKASKNQPQQQQPQLQQPITSQYNAMSSQYGNYGYGAIGGIGGANGHH